MYFNGSDGGIVHSSCIVQTKTGQLHPRSLSANYVAAKPEKQVDLYRHAVNIYRPPTQQMPTWIDNRAHRPQSNRYHAKENNYLMIRYPPEAKFQPGHPGRNLASAQQSIYPWRCMLGQSTGRRHCIFMTRRR